MQYTPFLSDKLLATVYDAEGGWLFYSLLSLLKLIIITLLKRCVCVRVHLYGYHYVGYIEVESFLYNFFFLRSFSNRYMHIWCLIVILSEMTL